MSLYLTDLFYCLQIYKSSSKRKAHILKNHPGQKLPLSARSKSLSSSAASASASGDSAPPQSASASAASLTFSATVGSVTTQPHSCEHCHKQYASNAKLLQHQRKKHWEKMPPEKQIPRSNGPKPQQRLDEASAVYQEEFFEQQQQQPSPSADDDGMDGMALIASAAVAAAATAAPPSLQQQQHPEHHVLVYEEHPSSSAAPALHLETARVAEALEVPAGAELVPLARVSTHQEMV